MPEEHEITELLRALGTGEKGALDGLFEAVYGELHRLAHGQRRRWRGEETLNTTALVHEAYLKIFASRQPRLEDRGHFFAVAAKAMRQILMDRARRSQAKKRGGAQVPVSLSSARLLEIPAATSVELLALDDALRRLAALDARQAQVVECRFFAGLGVEETAEAVGTSTATVKRDWRAARAWLYTELASRGSQG